jgi:hypothetical protein
MSKPTLPTAFLVILLISSLLAQPVRAASPILRGLPGSREFAYGASMDIDGMYVDESLEMAANLPLDWLRIEFNWSKFFPEPAASPDWSQLDHALSSAASHQINVLLSLSHAPGWAITPRGPSTEETSQLVKMLAARYRGVIRAVELFPGANTSQGWGTSPDPQAYASLLERISQNLAASNLELTLVSAGLQPLAPDGAAQGCSPAEGMNDLQFLEGLYQAGIQVWSQVISLQMSCVTGSPTIAPGGEELRVLRHYEEIRRIMVDHHQEGSLIWITSLNAPDGSINSADSPYQQQEAQAHWVTQAYAQLRSQLSIGAVFYDQVNPSSGGAVKNPPSRSLVLSMNQYHLLYNIFRGLIAQNSPQNLIILRGKPKDGGLTKDRP